MNIALADPHALFRAGLAQILGQDMPDTRCYEVADFGHLAELCRARVDINLVLTEFGLPGTSGSSLIFQIKSLRPRAPVVIVSAIDDPILMHLAIATGAAGFIPKSTSVPVLLNALHIIQTGGIYLPASILSPAPGAHSTPKQTVAAVAQLTQRQRQILNELYQGQSNKQIAEDLGIAESTVKHHCASILKALGVRTRTQAVVTASRLGLISHLLGETRL
jgi:DNA-binding NarL/FixJ family response regulator